MRRLSLGLQLAMILALAMITSLVVVVAVDRINAVHRSENDYYGTTDALALSLLELHAELPPEEFEIALELSRHPSNWLHVGPWDGLHPKDVRDEGWEAAILAQQVVSDRAVSAIRVGSRKFDYAPTRPPPGPRAVRSAPGALSIGDRPRPMLHRPPTDGSPHEWVTQPLPDNQDGIASSRGEPEYQRRERSVTVYTVALQTEQGGDWIVVYRLLRPPPLGGTISIAFYALLAGLCVAALALLIGRRVMTPFRQVAQQAELLGRGERAPEVPVAGPRDVREIVSAFNSMNARVSQATDYQIGLLRSLGHDLKGPLAAVSRLVSEVGPNDTRAQIETRLGNVQAIVEDIMSFSRAVMRDGDLEVTDMAAMLDAVIDEQADLGVDAIADTPGRMLLKCRANAMERCLRNLVENAIKYGGSVRATLAQEGDEAVIRIEDNGPGIPESEIESAFQPFYRLADDEGGTGLGLAIARTIVIDQGGTLALSNRTTGGLRAELRLPLNRTRL